MSDLGSWSTEADRVRKASLGNAPRIAVIGCGAIVESYYLPAIAKYPSVLERLVLVDSNEARAQKAACAFNVHNYVCDYHEILNEVDAAIIAVPHHLHYRISMDFLIKGVHVLCEKPLAVSSVEAKEMVAQAEKSGVTISVNNTRRLFPSYPKIKELVSAGTIGNLLSLKYFDGEDFRWPTASGFYFNSETSPKGVLLDRGAHVLDAICWWLGGKPKLLSCETDSFGGPEAVASIEFEHNNCSGQVRLSWLSKLQNTYKIIGELGVIEGGIEEWGKVTVTFRCGKTKKIKLESEEENYNDFGNRVVTNLLGVVSKGEKPIIPASEVIPSIELIEECYSIASRFNMPWYET